MFMNRFLGICGELLGPSREWDGRDGKRAGGRAEEEGREERRRRTNLFFFSLSLIHLVSRPGPDKWEGFHELMPFTSRLKGAPFTAQSGRNPV